MHSRDISLSRVFSTSINTGETHEQSTTRPRNSIGLDQSNDLGKRNGFGTTQQCQFFATVQGRGRLEANHEFRSERSSPGVKSERHGSSMDFRECELETHS